ncbi:M3 family oligoendopeptidase [Hazenella sp. IB182357]|uniref:M3 family oligoendopeptidase n=1 Tax=Polycladospora coralii TaxID=2771432 RepID=A0A926RT10_9BACL|nr:M3 family oligoendopeptidase [Polycladospora coralii]MBD1371083.1 M3 family oligoendopeptidase [Polycladospora coralii]
MRKFPLNWNLENIYAGGSASPALLERIEETKLSLSELKEVVQKIDDQITASTLYEILQRLQKYGSYYADMYSFVECLIAQDVKDQQAKILLGQIHEIGAIFNAVNATLDSKLIDISSEVWTNLLKYPEMEKIAFVLSEKRAQAKEKLSPAQEELAGDLSVDGYHAWSGMYDTIVGRMQIPYEENGETKSLSVGQLSNKFATKDNGVRAKVAEIWESAWENEAELCATSLNHIAGYRLQLYKHRKWDHVLKEPLANNRMTADTLDAMWNSIVQEKHRLVPYMERKAKMLGIDKLGMLDIYAPLGSEGKSFTYDEACEFIINHFRKFNTDMADFAEMALSSGWIEAEDRNGKRPGGFMTEFPVASEGRIFMTFSGTSNCVSTLAHELGHAYHSYVMKDLPLFAQQYRMNVAETASTFAETIVIDAAIKAAKTKEEKITLLAEKIDQAVAFLMDIHARFLFENRFYEARKEGAVSTESLCELMIAAQKEAFADTLGSYHPHFWASKLHFYGTDVPFYNFPYTFGYLFSSGIYARAIEEGTGFGEKYVDLLRDTASMTVEDLAERHLQIDLTQPDFWKNAIDLVMTDVEEFLALTDEQ